MDFQKSIAAVLCVRTSSNRMPGKVLTEIDKKWTLLDQCIWRLRMALSVGTIIVATSDDESDDPIEEAVNSMSPAKVVADVHCYRGSLDNVVERMWDAVHTCGNGEPFIYRAMGDQPFMDWNALDRSAALMLEHKWDTVLPLAFKEDPVYGAGVAPWSYKAFQAIRDHSTRNDELEHAGMWLKRNVAQFEYGLLDLPHLFYRPYRFEVDTQADMNLTRALHKRWKAGHLPLRSVIRHLDTKPQLTNANAHIEEKTGTYTSFTDAEIAQWQKDFVGRTVVWSDSLGLLGNIEAAQQIKYRCPECDGALIALSIVRGDLELECAKCKCKKKYYSAKPKK
jgi:spore coat polysaccharide biosynthesis protein SpsF (cytidylyltransferase family)